MKRGGEIHMIYGVVLRKMKQSMMMAMLAI